MFRLSKKVEYAILALQYMAEKDEAKTSVKEMSENLNISFDFLSKTMQLLNKKGLVESLQGIRGGYILGDKPEKISIADIIRAVEQRIGIVQCFKDGKDSCGRVEDCTIRTPMGHIQKKIDNIFESTTIKELAGFARK